jgi:hypothetical protein
VFACITRCAALLQGEPPEEEQLDINYGNIHRVVTSLGSPGYHPAFAGRHLAQLQVRCAVLHSHTYI